MRVCCLERTPLLDENGRLPQGSFRSTFVGHFAFGVTFRFFTQTFELRSTNF